MDKTTLEQLEKLLDEEHHVIQFTDRGWTIAHPLKERLNDTLFSCRVTWNDGDPGWRGRYWLLEDGIIGDPYPVVQEEDRCYEYNHPCKIASCETCEEIMYWIDCPTGGWWKHVDHPEDSHEGNAPVPVHAEED